MFQSTVRYDQGGGLPGEKAYDSPTRAEPGILAAAGVVGRIFSEDPAKPGFWSPGTQAGALRYALLTNPKQFAARGTQAGGPLAPTLTLPANAEGEFSSMGQFFALTKTLAKPGYGVAFDDVTGEISAYDVSGSVPAGNTQLDYATIAPLPGNAAGLTVVTLNGPMA